MTTKNNPGAYDCYSKAEPDEPMFVLLGRDPMAGALVRAWAELRRMSGEAEGKVAEARACAVAMDEWAKALGKQPLFLAFVEKNSEGDVVIETKTSA